MMENECTKFYILQGTGGDSNSKFKNPKFDNTFYELQMLVGKPTYFSPNLLYRIFIDKETKQIVIGNTLMNTECLRIEIKENLMYQAKDSPMVYFHDNDKIVYLTV